MDRFVLEIDLLFTLLRNMGVVVAFAYVLSRTMLFKRFFYSPLSFKDRIFLIFFFGLLSLSGTYLGIYLMDAYANIRAIGAIVAGFLGGPLVGVLAGAIGGFHRYTLGGFTAFACALGTMLSGLAGGLFHRAFRKQRINGEKAFYIGAGALLLEMLIVLIFSRPFEQALQLISVITLPMVISNALGISIFVNILNSVAEETENIKAKQARVVLDIASKTLEHFRKGMTCKKAAQEAASIILEMTDVAAVAITDKEKILGFAGAGSDHHKAGEKIMTTATKQAIDSGSLTLITQKKKIGCPVKDCPLSSAVVVPLKWDDRVMGALKLYSTEEKISRVNISLAAGIASLLSTQIQLIRLSEQAQLKTQAELKALQAQINPHFLFNSLNTIASFVRTDPDKARDLLLHLSDFFRSTLCKGHDLVPLKKELDSVRNYYSIEKARFGERINLIMEIPENTLKVLVPGFTLQPLVENAIKHGIMAGKKKGIIIIKADIDKDNVLCLEVQDDGAGIPPEKLDKILVEGYGSGTGIGLSNVSGRLINLYGPEYKVKIESQQGYGTRILLKLPVQYSGEEQKVS